MRRPEDHNRQWAGIEQPAYYRGFSGVVRRALESYTVGGQFTGLDPVQVNDMDDTVLRSVDRHSSLNVGHAGALPQDVDGIGAQVVEGSTVGRLPGRGSDQDGGKGE